MPLCDGAEGAFGQMVAADPAPSGGRGAALRRAAKAPARTDPGNADQGYGLVERKVCAEVPPRVEYSLTEIGGAFRAVLESLEQWGKQYIAFLSQKDRK